MRRVVVRFVLALLGVAGLVVGCVPASAPAPVPRAVADGSEAVFDRLLAPFTDTLVALGVRIDGFEVYRYDGDDPDAFLLAVDAFYSENPGFCPLEEAFHPAVDGLRFLTLAGNNGLEVRGFLYDQSHRPRLTYAYFWGGSDGVLPAITCQTVSGER